MNHLATLDDIALGEFMEKVWSQKQPKRYWQEEEKSERWQMINSMEKLLSDTKFTQHKESQNVFELLLFMCGCSESYAQEVYMKYQRMFGNKQQLENVQRVTLSNKLVVLIEQMKSRL